LNIKKIEFETIVTIDVYIGENEGVSVGSEYTFSVLKNWEEITYSGTISEAKLIDYNTIRFTLENINLVKDSQKETIILTYEKFS